MKPFTDGLPIGAAPLVGPLPADVRGRPAGPPRSVGVVTNLRSRRNQARTGSPRIVSSGVLEASPASHGELRETLSLFARRRIDLLVIDGGDGTVRDVLTAASEFFPQMPAIAVVPSGKTNALGLDLGAPDDWTTARAIEAAAQGRFVERAPLEITRAGDETPAHRGFLLGAGGFVRATDLAQRTHRWGAFNGIAVGLSLSMAIAQTAFGGAENVWQRGEAMTLRTAEGAALDQRLYLMLASTLERLPLGLKPFGAPRAGLKLLAVDAPARRILTSVPALLRGVEAPWLASRGYHHIDSAAVDLVIDGSFVLDGEAYPGGALRIATGTPLRFVAA